MFSIIILCKKFTILKLGSFDVLFPVEDAIKLLHGVIKSSDFVWISNGKVGIPDELTQENPFQIPINVIPVIATTWLPL